MAEEITKSRYKYKIKKLREEQGIARLKGLSDFSDELESTIQSLKKEMYAKYPTMLPKDLRPPTPKKKGKAHESASAV